MWGLSSISELNLTSKRRPMPRLRGYRTGTRGAPSNVPQQSTCHQITAVWGASHPTSGEVASTPLFIQIYIGVVGEKLPTHTTPLRLLRWQLGLLRRHNFLCFHLQSS